VPVHTLKALDLPIATMLLPEKLRITALLDAIKPDVRSQYPRLSEYEVEEAAHDWLADTLADNDEILGL
jgi:hypothetical protein